MNDESSVGTDALKALILTIGFYGMAILCALIVMVAPFVLAFVTRIASLWLIIGGFAVGGSILYALFSVQDKFIPRGTRLKPEEHPELFEVLRECAEKAGQNMPEFVYLLPELNAFAGFRDGTGIYGGTWMLGVGLPLIGTMTVSQLKAVLTHEFAHFSHGDSNLTVPVFRTRNAILRVIAELERRASWMQAPFKWYAWKYIRMTASVSRYQEYLADRVAAEAYGKAVTIDMLKRLAAMSVAYDLYVQSEYSWVLELGFRPPLLEGFDKFMETERVRTFMAKLVTDLMEQAEPSEFDDHPTFKQRIAALDEMRGEGKTATDDRPALSLLRDSEEQERRLIRGTVGESEFAVLKPVPWDFDFKPALLEAWRMSRRKFARVFPEMTVRDLPGFVKDPASYGKRLVESHYSDVGYGPLLFRELARIFCRAFALMLVERGWEWQMKLGEATTMHKGEWEVQPFEVVGALTTGRITADWFLSRVEAYSIADELLFQQTT